MANESIPGTSSSIVVPAFASHWGVVVGEPKNEKLFHFDSTLPNFYKPLPNAKHLGETRYTNDQLEVLREVMILEFGRYHRVFWNCQTFAKCYLHVITGDTQSDFVN